MEVVLVFKEDMLRLICWHVQRRERCLKYKQLWWMLPQYWQEGVLCELLHADDIVLISETIEGSGISSQNIRLLRPPVFEC